MKDPIIKIAIYINKVSGVSIFFYFWKIRGYLKRTFEKKTKKKQKKTYVLPRTRRMVSMSFLWNMFLRAFSTLVPPDGAIASIHCLASSTLADK